MSSGERVENKETQLVPWEQVIPTADGQTVSKVLTNLVTSVQRCIDDIRKSEIIAIIHRHRFYALSQLTRATCEYEKTALANCVELLGYLAQLCYHLQDFMLEQEHEDLERYTFVGTALHKLHLASMSRAAGESYELIAVAYWYARLCLLLRADPATRHALQPPLSLTESVPSVDALIDSAESDQTAVEAKLGLMQGKILDRECESADVRMITWSLEFLCDEMYGPLREACEPSIPEADRALLSHELPVLPSEVASEVGARYHRLEECLNSEHPYRHVLLVAFMRRLVNILAQMDLDEKLKAFVEEHLQQCISYLGHLAETAKRHLPRFFQEQDFVEYVRATPDQEFDACAVAVAALFRRLIPTILRKQKDLYLQPTERPFLKNMVSACRKLVWISMWQAKLYLGSPGGNNSTDIRCARRDGREIVRKQKDVLVKLDVQGKNESKDEITSDNPLWELLINRVIIVLHEKGPQFALDTNRFLMPIDTSYLLSVPEDSKTAEYRTYVRIVLPRQACTLSYEIFSVARKARNSSNNVDEQERKKEWVHQTFRGIIYDILVHLDVMHNAHLFAHRDIKPDNIFLYEDESGRKRARLGDYGSTYPMLLLNSDTDTARYSNDARFEFAKALSGRNEAVRQAWEYVLRNDWEEMSQLHEHQQRVTDVWNRWLESLNREGSDSWGLLPDLSHFQVKITENRKGTFGYCAPEVISEEGVDPRPADIYSLGATIFHCLCEMFGYQQAVLIDDDLTDLIAKMIAPKSTERVTVRQALTHRYFTDLRPRHVTPLTKRVKTL